MTKIWEQPSPAREEVLRFARQYLGEMLADQSNQLTQENIMFFWESLLSSLKTELSLRIKNIQDDSFANELLIELDNLTIKDLQTTL